jgi:hypothetical protein
VHASGNARSARAAGRWIAGALLAFSTFSATHLRADELAAPVAVYKSYIYTTDDAYHCTKLAPHVEPAQNPTLGTINERALRNCRAITRLQVSGIRLTDDYNPTVVAEGKNARITLHQPATLFAPFALTYDPDPQWRDRLGWPVRNRALQQQGYDTVQAGRPSCMLFDLGGASRLSPYTSHCSAYVAWVADRVFAVNLFPTALNDYCHLAAEQRDRMLGDTANWVQMTAVDAQIAANGGALVVAARKVSDPSRPAHNQNGHIAIVLPNVTSVAAMLQDGTTYPAYPLVQSDAAFAELIRIFGPEITQAGGLNFAHTVAANGFAGYYPKGTTVGITPIDDVIEFFTYKHSAPATVIGLPPGD